MSDVFTINNKEYHNVPQDLIQSEHDREQAYLEMLSECYGEVRICGYTYDAGEALKEIDPTAFRCGFADYTSEEYNEVWKGQVFVGYISNDDLDSLDEEEEDSEEETDE